VTMTAAAPPQLGWGPIPSMQPPQLAAASTASRAASGSAAMAAMAAVETAAWLGGRPAPSMQPPPQLTASAAAPPEPPSGGDPSSSSSGPALPARDRRKRARSFTGEPETVTTPQDNQAKKARPDDLAETSASTPRDSSSSLVWQNLASASEPGSFHPPAPPGD